MLKDLRNILEKEIKLSSKKIMKLIYNKRYILVLVQILLLPSIIWAHHFQDICYVDTTKQLYSYNEMMEDIDSLTYKYLIISYEIGDYTYQKRPIPIIYFGNENADKFVMIQATMHAREYMATLLVMSLLDYYATNLDNLSYKGISYTELFEKVCLVIIPMVNPDGVEIAQKGLDGARTEDVKSWLKLAMLKDSLNQIKSNARGVDINRNFRNGFGKAKYAKQTKNLYHFMGEKPYSEIESRLLLTTSEKQKYSCFINYHTSGNVIYYGCQNADKAVNVSAFNFAKVISELTGYPSFGPTYARPSGTWADEVEMLYKRPSMTIEIGTKNPVPIQEFKQIFEKNLLVWAAIAYEVIK